MTRASTSEARAVRGARTQPVRSPPQCDFDELPTVMARASWAANGQRHRTAVEVDLGDRLVDDGHGAGLPQGAGEHGAVVVAHERPGGVVEVGDEQRDGCRGRTHGAGGLGDVPAVGVHGERHEPGAAAPGGVDGVGVAGRLDDHPVAVPR